MSEQVVFPWNVKPEERDRFLEDIFRHLVHSKRPVDGIYFGINAKDLIDYIDLNFNPPNLRQYSPASFEHNMIIQSVWQRELAWLDHIKDPLEAIEIWTNSGRQLEHYDEYDMRYIKDKLILPGQDKFVESFYRRREKERERQLVAA